MHDRVENARRQLDRLRKALASASPREIEEALPEMERGVASMKEVEQAISGGEAPPADLTSSLLALSKEIGLVQRLAERGMELCNGQASLLAISMGGYIASGQPAPLTPSSNVEIEG